MLLMLLLYYMRIYPFSHQQLKMVTKKVTSPLPLVTLLLFATRGNSAADVGGWRAPSVWCQGGVGSLRSVTFMLPQ